MNAKARTARRTTRDRARTNRTIRAAAKAVATGAPQPAKTHLIAAGLDIATARRYAGAFSQRVTPTATATTVLKLKGRVTKRVQVKLYDLPAFTARLAAYRPRDARAAAQFAALALAA